MVIVHVLGHVSGAHFDPAVTAAFAASGHLPLARVLPHASAQEAAPSARSARPSRGSDTGAATC